jgi:hypothetical protein
MYIKLFFQIQMLLNQLDTIIQTAMRVQVVIIMQVIIISTLCAEMNGPNHSNPNVLMHLTSFLYVLFYAWQRRNNYNYGKEYDNNKGFLT